MDCTRHNDGEGLASTDGVAVATVGREVQRTATRKAALRLDDLRQDGAIVVPTDQHFIRREASSDFSEYWGTVTDPDGNKRNRLSAAEQQQFISDISEELDFIVGLAGDDGLSVADIGCGPGWFLEEVDYRAPGGCNGVGVEVSPTAMAETRRRGFACLESTAELETSGYDVVFCHHVIEHMARPTDAIADMLRILKPGGWLVLGTPDFGGACAAMFGSRYRMLHDPTHCSLFTNESLHRFLRDSGFSVAKVSYPFADRYWDQLADYIGGLSSGWSPPIPGNHMTFYAQKAN